MGTSFANLSDLLNHGFDTAIDVRSPAEFAEDHVPGAINLPALSNAQRAEVGTIYVQDCPFKARKVGAAMVARNVADHLNGPLADMDGGWQPLVYCWRGGQRSGSFASILSQIGWRAEVVEGGYQSFRRLVHDALYSTPLPYRLILLDGNTGTAKTDILHRLEATGTQVLDLEGIANHRGSLLGGMADEQPSQKAFETRLATALSRFDQTRPVIVEAESSKVGARIVPPMVWQAMKTAPRIEISTTLDARAAYLAEAYGDLSNDPDDFGRKLEFLRRHRGGLVDGWLAMLRDGKLIELAKALMEVHYDPTYRASRARHETEAPQRFDVTDLSEASRAELATRIGEWVQTVSEM